MNDPEVLFLDEPTTGLDPQARRTVWTVIRSLRKGGRTIFLTTHYLEEAQSLADRVAIIDHGKIIAHGTPGEIIERFGRPQRLVLEGPPSLAKALEGWWRRPVSLVNGRTEVEVQAKEEILEVLQWVSASGLAWSGVGTTRDTLEDVFVRLVGRIDEGGSRASEPGTDAKGGRT